jgi:hypothetical protein
MLTELSCQRKILDISSFGIVCQANQQDVWSSTSVQVWEKAEDKNQNQILLMIIKFFHYPCSPVGLSIAVIHILAERIREKK